MVCRVCIAQIQPRDHALDHHADYAAPTRQHEIDDADQEHVRPERSTLPGISMICRTCETSQRFWCKLLDFRTTRMNAKKADWVKTFEKAT